MNLAEIAHKECARMEADVIYKEKLRKEHESLEMEDANHALMMFSDMLKSFGCIKKFGIERSRLPSATPCLKVEDIRNRVFEIHYSRYGFSGIEWHFFIPEKWSYSVSVSAECVAKQFARWINI